MKRSLLATAGMVLLLAAGTYSQNEGAERLRAGAHKVDFTPDKSELRISMDSIRDHLFTARSPCG